MASLEEVGIRLGLSTSDIKELRKDRRKWWIIYTLIWIAIFILIFFIGFFIGWEIKDVDLIRIDRTPLFSFPDLSYRQWMG